MANVTLQQLIAYAQKAGFKGAGLKNIVAISEAEDTSGNPLATNSVGNSAGIDRGVLQINSFYHGEVTNSCAFDPQCAFNAAFKISDSGTNFTPWSTFGNGSYLKYLNDTTNVSTTPTTSTTGFDPTNIASSLQNMAVPTMFVVGGVIVIIMGFALTFHPKRLPI